MTSSRAAGEFARDRYRARHRRWLLRVWWALPLAGLWVFSTFAILGLVFYPDAQQFWLGAGLGSALTAMVMLAARPPQRIENWKLGWEGEKQTAKGLARLDANTWRVLHDVPAPRGNYDHVVVGPDAVYLLETKNLSGTLEVRDGWLFVTHPEEPEHTQRTQHDLDTKVVRAAIGLRDRLSPPRGDRVYVHGVVVFVGRLPQRIVSGRNIHWVAGDELARFIAGHATSRRRPYDVDVLEQRLRDDSLVERPGSIAPPSAS